MVSPLFWTCGVRIWIGAWQRQEALTQNISHARGITRPMFLVASCMLHRSLSKRKGTLHATHTPGSARRPAAQKFELFDICH